MVLNSKHGSAGWLHVVAPIESPRRLDKVTAKNAEVVCAHAENILLAMTFATDIRSQMVARLASLPPCRSPRLRVLA